MSTDTLATKEALKAIFARLNKGELTYDKAKVEAQPYIAELNKLTKAKTAELNKKYNMHRKPVLVDFINLRRSQEML